MFHTALSVCQVVAKELNDRRRKVKVRENLVFKSCVPDNVKSIINVSRHEYSLVLRLASM